MTIRAGLMAILLGVISACLVFGCITTGPQTATVDNGVDNKDFKQGVYLCEGKWYDIVVPSCLPDNLANNVPLSQPDDNNMVAVAYQTPEGGAIIVFDADEGVCGLEFIIAASCNNGQSWIMDGGLWKESNPENISQHMQSYRSHAPEGEDA